MVETMTAAQNRPSTPLQMTVISEIVSSPIVGVPVNVPPYQMPPNRPWGMPLNFMPEGYIPPVTGDPRTTIPGGYRPKDAEEQRNAAVMSVPPPVMHITPHA